MPTDYAKQKYDGFEVSLDPVGIATIKLNRPASLNAITRDCIRHLTDVITEFASDHRVIICVLTGSGRYFSAGIDIGTGGASGGSDPNPGEVRRNFHQGSAGSSSLLVRRIANFPKIFVAALNGPVVGIPGGWSSHADIIYATPDTTIHASFVTLALAPLVSPHIASNQNSTKNISNLSHFYMATRPRNKISINLDHSLYSEAATSLSFPLRMGLGRASEALIFARKMNADELVTAGYINRLFPKETFHADVHAHLKGLLAECNPRSMFEAKRIIRQSLQYGSKVSAHLLNEVDFVADQYVRGEPVQAFAKLAERQARLREEKKKAKL